MLHHELAASFFNAVLDEARGRGLLSDNHFTVDRTLPASWASLQSLRPRGDAPPPRPSDGTAGLGEGGRNLAVDFQGERCSHQMRVSTTDVEARLACKGKGKDAKLCLAGHPLRENRNGLPANMLVTQTTSTAEREAALVMLDRRPQQGHRVTLGAD